MGKVSTVPVEIYSEVHGKFAKDDNGDVQKLFNADCINHSIRAIIKTKPGERVMLPEFGCNLDWLLFEPIDEDTAAKIGYEITNAIGRWEDRCAITQTLVIPKPQDSTYDVSIDYYLVSLPDQIHRLNITLISLST